MRCDHCEELREEIAYLQRELGLQKHEDAVTRLGQRWGLSNTEAKILAHLHARRGACVSKSQLWDALYADGSSEPEVKIVDVFICKLRHKLPRPFVETIWGRGYALTGSAVATCDEVLEQPAVTFAGNDPQQPRETPLRRDGRGRTLAIVKRLAEGAATFRDLEAVLPPEAGYMAGRLAAEQVRRGRAVRVAGRQPGQLSVWKITAEGIAFLAAHGVTLPERAA